MKVTSCFQEVSGIPQDYQCLKEDEVFIVLCHTADRRSKAWLGKEELLYGGITFSFVFFPYIPSTCCYSNKKNAFVETKLYIQVTYSPMSYKDAKNALWSSKKIYFRCLVAILNFLYER